MKEYHQFYINGSWVDPINGLNKLDVLNPATEEPIGSIALGSSEDVNAAVDAAKNAFASFSSSEKEARVGYLEKIEEIYTHETNFFEKNYLTGEYLPKAIPVIKRTIRRHNWSIENRENLYTNTKEHCVSLGANWHDLEQTKALIDKQELKEIGLAVPKYVQENLEKRLLGVKNEQNNQN